MAAQFVASHQDRVRGLVLWASYPALGNDLSKSNVSVISIYGTRDGLVTSKEIDSSHALLPPGTKWISILGGNHGQFGLYGHQPGDNEASISWMEQQHLIVGATLDFLHELQSH